MPNHYTNVLHVFKGYHADPEGDRDLLQELTERKWTERPLNRVVPMPSELENTISPTRPNDTAAVARLLKYGAENWYDWQITNRGIKWDAYDALPPTALPGDCHAVQLTFCTAWGPPNERTQRAIARELIEQYGADRVVWCGLNPYDDTFAVVGQWSHPLPHDLPEVARG